MNFWTGIGRLTKDVTVNYSQDGSAIGRYSLAVNRNFKNSKGEYDSDFINVVVFGKAAEFAENYFRKGMKVAVQGRIQTGSYKNKDGNTVYTTDIIAEHQEFVESKNGSSENSKAANVAPDASGFMDVAGDEDFMPFN